MRYNKSREWHNFMFKKYFVRVRRNLKRPLIVIKKRVGVPVLLQVQNIKHVFNSNLLEK